MVCIFSRLIFFILGMNLRLCTYVQGVSLNNKAVWTRAELTLCIFTLVQEDVICYLGSYEGRHESEMLMHFVRGSHGVSFCL